MKKYYILMLLIFEIYQIPCFSQNYKYISIFGLNGYDDVRGLILHKNGQVSFTGLTKSEKDTAGDVYLSTLDTFGQLINHATFGRKNEDGGNGLLQTSDGGLLICGHTALPDFGTECDAMVTKLGANFNVEWQVNVGDERDETCYEAVEMKDHSYWIVGVLHNESNSTYQGLIFHIDHVGQIIGYNTLADTYGNQLLNRIKLAENGDLLVSGLYPDQFFDDNSGGGFSLISFLSSFSSTKEYNSMPNYFQKLMLQNSKMYDFLVLPNYTLVVGTSNYNFLSIKEDEIGLPWIGKVVNGVLDKKFNSPLNSNLVPRGSIRAISKLPNGKIYMVGELLEAGLTKGFYAILSDDLKLEKLERLPIKSNSSARCFALSAEGILYIGGHQWSNNESQMLIISVDPYGMPNASTKIDKIVPYVFPNPCQNVLNIFTEINNSPKHIIVTDLQGSILLDQFQSESQMQIDIKLLPPGCYLYQLNDMQSSEIYYGKFIKE